jgi:hypothetical protein
LLNTYVDVLWGLCLVSDGESFRHVRLVDTSQTPYVAGAPLARLDLVFNASKCECAVLFSCEHSVCDGMSIGCVVHDLLRFATASVGSDTPVAPTPVTNSFEALCAANAAVTHDASHKWPAYTPWPHPKPQFPIPGSSSVAAMGILTLEQSQELLSRCRARGVTVNSIIAAAMHYAVGAELLLTEASPVTSCLTCCADTRRFYSPPLTPEVLGYHVSGTAPLYHDFTQVSTSGW